MYKVGVTASIFNINQHIVDRFNKYLKASIAMDKDVISLQVYLSSLESEVLTNGIFNLSKAKNSGIKELISSGCDVIITADIDVIVPPHLIKYSVNKSVNHSLNVLGMTRFIDESQFDSIRPDWKQFLRFPVAQSGYGCWNCLSVDNWKLSGGYPEDLVGWGYEDVCFREKLQFRNIDTTSVFTYPLLHINHPPRANNQSLTQQQNVQIANSKDILSSNWI